jgi:hypothetical protein
MKKEVVEILDWCKENLKKYGMIVFILVALWMGLKKIWYWIVMPVLLLITFRFFADIIGWQWVSKINVMYLILSWVFVFSIFKKLGKLMFKV